jgi:ABC-type transport system involved in cytochrome c biogenesis permease subunit
MLRGQQIGFLPFASQFDSMVLFAMAIQVSGLILFLFCRSALVKFITDLISLIILGAAVVFVGIKSPGLLSPLLDSPYFAFHIIGAFGGYGVFVGGFAWSIASIFDRQARANLIVPLKLAVIGLILLGAGILFGAIWADNSWGIYWSWDPKESWALLTWLIFAAYLHIYPKNQKPWLTGLFYTLGIMIMLFTFIGINVLKIGLHSH